MSDRLAPKLLVVGGGPGGYVTAIRAGQLGIETVLVDAERLGGTCLVRGCIPSKALIHAASLHDEMVKAASAPRFGISLPGAPILDLAATTAWKDATVDRLSGGVAALLRKAKVKVISGRAVFSDAKHCTVAAEGRTIEIAAEHVVLATGSLPVAIPALPFGGKVISSSEALSLSELPRTLAIIGGGYIGLELGIAFRKLGAAVTVVEAKDRILPQYDRKLTEPVARWLEANGVTLHTGATAIRQDDAGLTIRLPDGELRVVEADRILVTAGRKPNTAGWGLETMNLAMNGAFVRVDERCATSTTNVWAIGDLVGEPMLAHKASFQGEMVAEIIAGRRRRFDPVAIPEICFTEPEIVCVGLAPDTVPSGTETVVGVFPFAANGRALSMSGHGDADGFVRVVARASDHRILGFQAVGAHVSELANEYVALLEMGAVLEDVAGMMHPHPTLGETTHEVSLKALGHALHI